MSKRSWSEHIAGLILLSAILWLALWGILEFQRSKLEADEAYQNYQASSEHEQKKASEYIALECANSSASIDGIGKCLSEKVNTYIDAYSTKKDMKAQQDMAFWSKWMVYVGAAGVIVSIGGFFALLGSLAQTRATIKSNNTLLAAEIIPHISIVCAETEPIFIGPGGFRVGDEMREPLFQIYNAGRSTAVITAMYRMTKVCPKGKPLKRIKYPDTPRGGIYKQNFLVVGQGQYSSRIKIRSRRVSWDVSENDFVYFYGYVVYKDISERFYVRGYCMVYTHEGVFAEAWPAKNPSAYNYENSIP